jgi:hypothetical protein
MRAVQILSVALALLIVAVGVNAEQRLAPQQVIPLEELSALQQAQSRITEPGVYEANAAILPALLPAIPAGLPDLGPDVFYGYVTIAINSDGTYAVSFEGNRADGARGQASGVFGPDWAGLKFGPLVVGDEQIENCITGIDVANLLSASATGIGHVDGRTRQVVKAEFGYQAELLRWKDVPAPAIYRDEFK